MASFFWYPSKRLRVGACVGQTVDELDVAMVCAGHFPSTESQNMAALSVGGLATHYIYV